MSRSMHKHGATLFFIAACFLLAISLGFSVYSFARFVSVENPAGTHSGVAGIECEYDVNRGSSDSFINAPFILQMPGSTRPAQMNEWAESVIRVHNSGTSGLKYEYGFVFYMPQQFAENVMFQLAELKDGNYTAGTTDTIERAGDIFCIDDAKTGIAKTEATADGQPIPNDYEDLIAAGKYLHVDTAKSSAVLQEKTEHTAFKRMYGAYEPGTSESETGRFFCPISFTDSAELRYYRITVNIARDADRYVLHDDETHYFLFRLVLRDPMGESSSGESDANDLFASVWNVDDYWERDAAGNYTQALQTPVPSGNYDCRWLQNADPKIAPAVQLAPKGTDVWQTVAVRTCMGVGSPCKINVVFTQTV